MKRYAVLSCFKSGVITILCVYILLVKCDLTQPLFLTPFIKNGSLELGKNLSAVNSFHMLNTTSYSGHITVNKEYNSNIWFWYFPVKKGRVKKAPLVIWLQGGPGISSLYSLFQGVGPFSYEDGKLIENRHSWHKKHSLLFIDNPIGSGYSFTDSEEGYSRNQTQISLNLYEFLVQFMKLFPELQKRPLFLSGQSYAGKHIPAFAHLIHLRNPNAQLKINLKGMMIGNGWIDPPNLYKLSAVAYELGIIDDNLVEKLKVIENKLEKALQDDEWLVANELQIDILVFMTVEAHLHSLYNYMTDIPCFHPPAYEEFLDTKLTREILHVGEVPYMWSSVKANNYLDGDRLKSVKPQLETLLEHYRVLVYNGQLDLMVPYANLEIVYRNLEWSGAKQYRMAKRKPWMKNGKLVGYKKKVKNFEEVLIRNAGHCVATEKPEVLEKLINSFTGRHN